MVLKLCRSGPTALKSQLELGLELELELELGLNLDGIPVALAITKYITNADPYLTLTFSLTLTLP